jgi:ribosome-binding factor A
MAKTGYSRAERVADQIRMEVADILMRRIKDPRVRSVTVTDVELTNDLRIARVFVTALGTEAETKDVFAGLSKASGFIRSELGRRLTLRYLPEVVFHKDVSGPRGFAPRRANDLRLPVRPRYRRRAYGCRSPLSRPHGD